MLTLTDACTELCCMYCITNLFSLSEQMWRLQRGLSRLPASVAASRHPHTLPQLTCTPSQSSHTSHYHHSTSSHSGTSRTRPERAANRFETGQTGFGRGTNRSLSGQAGFARAPNQSGTSQTTIFDRDREGVREERERDEEEGEGGRGEGGGRGGEGTRRAQLLTLATVSATAALGSLYLLLQQWRAKADGGGGVVTVMVGHMITFHFLPFLFLRS